MRRPSELQRRNAFRLSVAVRPRVAHVIYGPARKAVRLGVIDVSASGLRVRSQDELHPGELLELAFDLDGEVYLHARVLRIHRRERAWDAGCEFVGVPERLAERIVKFIFAEQRQMLHAQRGVDG
jgi:c-di-GMP-binding flagellar brake protein YcgR